MWISPKHQACAGKVLADLRKETGVTQLRLAETLGKPQSFVSSYESGQRRVDVLELIAIADALGGDPLAFLARIVAAVRAAPAG